MWRYFLPHSFFLVHDREPRLGSAHSQTAQVEPLSPFSVCYLLVCSVVGRRVAVQRPVGTISFRFVA